MRKWEKDGLEFRIWPTNLNDDTECKTGEPDKKVMEITRKLVRGLMFEMAKNSKKYVNSRYDLNDLPFTYNERSLDAIFLPALHKLCKGVIMTEVRVTRKIKDEDNQTIESNGHVDYWCIYNGYSYAIEMKHDMDDCYQTSKLTESEINNWKVMNEQLKNPTSDYKRFGEKTKGFITLGLHFITSRSGRRDKKAVIAKFNENIEDLNDKFVTKIYKNRPTTKPDLSVCWLIPYKLIDDQGYKHPGLWVLAKVNLLFLNQD